MAAYYVGNYEEAVSKIEKAIEMGYTVYKDSVADLMRMINIYEKIGNYSRVVELYEMAVEEQPQNPQLYASLAVAYAKVGDFDKARWAALKAAEIEPKFKDETQKFIDSLPD